MRIRREIADDGRVKRAWRYWWDTSRRSWHAGIYLLRDAQFTVFQFTRNLDVDYQCHLSIGIKFLFWVYLDWNGIKWNRQTTPPSARERTIGVNIHNGSAWLFFWGDRSGRGPLREYVFTPADFALGRNIHSLVVIRETEIRLHLPEGNIPAKATVKLRTWRRARLPFLKTQRYSVEIEPVVGIPIPGKGDNSWDLDDDAYYSTSRYGHDPYAAAKSFVSDVIRHRLEHGGYDWRPTYDVDITQYQDD